MTKLLTLAIAFLVAAAACDNTAFATSRDHRHIDDKNHVVINGQKFPLINDPREQKAFYEERSQECGPGQRLERRTVRQGRLTAHQSRCVSVQREPK